MAYIVLRIKGTINIPHWAERTMQLLNLRKRYNATIVSEDPSILGMLNKVKNYVAWYKTDATLIKEVLIKRGKKNNRKIEANDIEALGFKSIDELAEALASDKIRLSKIDCIKPWFALHPPRGGFKRSTKRMYSEKGVTGENPQLPDLIRRML